jgi:hypothetical protein
MNRIINEKLKDYLHEQTLWKKRLTEIETDIEKLEQRTMKTFPKFTTLLVHFLLTIYSQQRENPRAAKHDTHCYQKRHLL